MARTSGYPLADLAVDGKLGDILRGYAADGLSLFAMAKRLDDDHGLEVSPSTVRRWLAIAQDTTNHQERSA